MFVKFLFFNIKNLNYTTLNYNQSIKLLLSSSQIFY